MKNTISELKDTLEGIKSRLSEAEDQISELEDCEEPFHVWEMWFSPHSEKPVGSEVGRQDPHPWIGSPVGNEACIVP